MSGCVKLCGCLGVCVKLWVRVGVCVHVCVWVSVKLCECGVVYVWVSLSVKLGGYFWMSMELWGM